MDSRSFTATFSNFDSMMGFIRNSMESALGLKENNMQFEVAIEEAIVNIIKYAYPAPAGIIEIECSFEAADGYFTVKIFDSGTPFNPLKSNAIVPPVSIESQDLGGLGIYFMQKFSDHASYEYIDNRNQLTLKKRINLQGS